MLAGKTVSDVSVEDINAVFEGNLWTLSSDALLYFLPALMDAVLSRYDSVSVIASELLSALTKPTRADVLVSLDRLERQNVGSLLGDPLTAERLRAQQLEWFDSGFPTALFHERFHSVSAEEGRAILEFLKELRSRHGADFPFEEVDAAIARHWATYGSSPGEE